MHPRNNYSNGLDQLTINKNASYEIVRELISNSYDAKANNIYIYTHEQDQSIIFCDDGVGISTARDVNGNIPWESFFSLYSSTKSKTDPCTIGEKGVGSKLGFDCERFWLFSRSEDSACEEWSCLTLDKPKDTLSEQYDIDPVAIPKNEIVSKLRREWVGTATRNELDQIFEDLSNAIRDSAHGTVIVSNSLKLPPDSFSQQFATSDHTSFIRNYIRFHTRHGDVLALSTAAGFDKEAIEDIDNAFKRHRANLFLWKTNIGQNSRRDQVPYGFPYVKADDDDKRRGLTLRLRDAQHVHRYAKVINVHGYSYALILAVDGHKRVSHDGGFQELVTAHRKNSTIGVKLDDQRGSIACRDGVKIAQMKSHELWDTFDTPWHCLGDKVAAEHYVLFIEGRERFELNLARSGLTESALQLLQHDKFRKEFLVFLEEASTQGFNPAVFKEFLDRINEELDVADINKVSRLADKRKEKIATRKKFVLKKGKGDKEVLDRIVDETDKNSLVHLVAPEKGEEVLVEVLHAQCAGRVPRKSPLKGLWHLSRTLSGQGIDALGVSLSDIADSDEISKLKTIEYKVLIQGPSYTINHPLSVVDVIVAWEVRDPDGKGFTITDDYGCVGTLKKESDYEYRVTDLLSKLKKRIDKEVLVISLWPLIKATFDVEEMAEKIVAPAKPRRRRERF